MSRIRNTSIADRGSRVAHCFGRVPVRAILYLLSSILVVTTVPGCALFGALFYKVHGPTPVPAKYVPKKEPTLVLVENYRHPASVRLDAERLGRYIVEEFEGREIAPTIDPALLEELRARPDAKTMSQSAIGRALGAKQVLYVDLTSFNVEEALGSEAIKGKAEATLKLVDATTGDTLWPDAVTTGYPVALETPYVRVGEDTNEMRLREQMCRQLANQIGKLFRKWSPEYESTEGGTIR